MSNSSVIFVELLGGKRIKGIADEEKTRNDLDQGKDFIELMAFTEIGVSRMLIATKCISTVEIDQRQGKQICTVIEEDGD